MSKMDPYIEHALDIEFDRVRRSMERLRYLETPKIVLSLLLQVSDSEWRPAENLDVNISSRLGSIIACQAAYSAIEALRQDPSVVAIEADRPGSGFDTAQSLTFVSADVVHKDPNYSETGDQGLIAFIDTGIDIFHEAFLDANGNTRIAAIWDQSNNYGPGNTKLKASYGDVYFQTDIDHHIQSRTVPASLGRDTISGHGTHVASIAAGRAVGKFSGGVAPDAQIIVVKIPLSSQGTSTGYKKSHADALKFIDAMADSLHKPVVVNISQGMNAGAHDGTTLVEAAFDEFTQGGRRPGRVIVKSAGNERKTDVHAEIYVNTGGSSLLEWECLDDHEKTVIELWFHSFDELKFRLVNPDNESSEWASWSTPNIEDTFNNGNSYRITYTRFHPDNGDSVLIVSVKAGTANSILKTETPWKVEIEGVNVRTDGLIHAWIERDSTRPTKFLKGSEKFTISIPGTSRTVITVGSVNPYKPYSVADYSSYGPTRDARDKPDLVAPGNNISAAEAGTTNGTKSDNGTSMAAPHVSGAIALLYSYWAKHRSKESHLSAAQVRAALTQATGNFNGHSNPTMGFGALDIKRLLDTFPPQP